MIETVYSSETARELATRIGVSLSQAYRIMARERDRVAGWKDDSPDIDDATLLYLTDDPDRERRDWYSLRTDRTSLDSIGGRVLVPDRRGTRLRLQRLGTGSRVDHQKRDHKPDPKGLKGGVG